MTCLSTAQHRSALRLSQRVAMGGSVRAYISVSSMSRSTRPKHALNHQPVITDQRLSLPLSHAGGLSGRPVTVCACIPSAASQCGGCCEGCEPCTPLQEDWSGSTAPSCFHRSRWAAPATYMPCVVSARCIPFLSHVLEAVIESAQALATSALRRTAGCRRPTLTSARGRAQSHYCSRRRACRGRTSQTPRAVRQTPWSARSAPASPWPSAGRFLSARRQSCPL